MKKLTKKLTAAVLALVLALSFASCGLTPTQQAESAVRNALDAVKELKLDTAAQYMGVEDLFENDMFSGLPYGGEKLLEKLFDKLEYEIVASEQVSDEEVHVTTKLAAVDMKPIVGQFVSKGLEYVFANALAAPSEEETAKEMLKILDELLAAEDLAMVTSEVELTLVKTEDGWRIKADKLITDALLGGLKDALINLALG